MAQRTFLLATLVLAMSTCPNCQKIDNLFKIPKLADNVYLNGIPSTKDCNRDLGVSKKSQYAIDDKRMTASSSELGFSPHFGRLSSQKGWMPAVNDQAPYLMIDLHELMIVLRSATQGIGDVGLSGARVISYLLHHSIDGDTWSVVLENEHPKLFMGNVNSTSEVSSNFFSPVLTRYVKFVPHGWYRNIAMRVELYGCETGLGSPLGMTSNVIKEDRIKASSIRNSLFKPNHGRLKLNTGGGAWCAKSDVQATKQYFQISFEDPHILTGIATQGITDGKSWMKSYYMSSTLDRKRWLYYHDFASKKLFAGNMDEDTVKLHHFSHFFLALEVRIHPQTWHQYICLRAEIYGFSLWKAPFCKTKCYGDGKALCLTSPHKSLVQTCICAMGHEASGGSCEDIDECSIGYDLCGAKEVCVNRPSSFSCQCAPGYTQDGNDCKDVDECADKKTRCPYRTSCTNTEGSYTCDCTEPGFMGNGSHCIDINECQTGKYECKEHSSCVNAGGSYMCFCDEGFTGDGKVNCTDIDECVTIPKVCANHGTCKNTLGSYRCICKEGFTATGPDCQDIDECAAEPSVCDEHALCINIPGSFACQCKLGFHNFDNTCNDVNECQEKVTPCHAQADCYNTAGSYLCICKENFYGDGIVCASETGQCAEGDEDCESASDAGSEASKKTRKKRSHAPEKSSVQVLKPSQWFWALVTLLAVQQIFKT